MKTDARRRLPSVDAVVRAAGETGLPRARFVAAVREVLADARKEGRLASDADQIARAAHDRVAARDERTLRRVLNATGVVLQTNLGRAPLAPSALSAISEAAGAVSVEYDLAAGKRGERHGHAGALLRELAGAEDGVVVNNNAAAVLLALTALAARREVIVARGELVEIGGGFRIPDVLRRSGAKLIEVGTTNRTYVKDFAAAIGRSTGAIHDLGSGTFADTARHGLPHEETVAEAVAAGADVVTFSGDKLLGGPQAGLAVGRAAAIATLRAHPLMRALRPDKLTLAALIATLELYRDGRAETELPVWRMIAARPTDLARRARAVALRLSASGVPAEVVETRSTIGGGSLPEETQPSHAVALGATAGSAALSAAARLRRARPAIVARIVDDHVALDLRAILPEDDELLAATTIAAMNEKG